MVFDDFYHTSLYNLLGMLAVHVAGNLAGNTTDHL